MDQTTLTSLKVIKPRENLPHDSVFDLWHGHIFFVSFFKCCGDNVIASNSYGYLQQFAGYRRIVFNGRLKYEGKGIMLSLVFSVILRKGGCCKEGGKNEYEYK